MIYLEFYIERTFESSNFGWQQTSVEGEDPLRL